MPRYDGFKKELFENCISDLCQGHQDMARNIADFLIAGGSHPYAEGSTVDKGQKKYNFSRPSQEGAWIAIWGTREQAGGGLGPRLSLDIADKDRLLPEETEWYYIREKPRQFEKGGWRRLWLKVNDPTTDQIDELKEILREIKAGS